MDKKTQAMLETAIMQRNAALDNVVELVGHIKELQAKIEELEKEKQEALEVKKDK